MQSIRKDNYFLLFICFVVSLGGILYGYDLGVISGALIFIQQTIPMSEAQVGWLVGAVLGGGLLGTLIAGQIGDYYGRRTLLILSSLIFILGIYLIIIAQIFFIIFFARVLLGIGIGIISVAVPLYVAEMVPADHRGKYVAVFQLLVTFGILLAYIIDYFFAASQNWRAMFAIVLIPAILLFVGMLFLPETPRWLFVNSQPERARAILKNINFKCLNEEEIITSLTMLKGNLKELFSKSHLAPTCAAIMIAIFNQLTGINSFLQYAPLLLKEAGLQSHSLAMIGSVTVGLLNFLCTLVALFLIDQVGRKPLLLIGIIGIIISECFLGLITLLPLSHFMSGIFYLIGLSSFIIFFALGPGVVIWLVLSELFPTQVRSKAMGICLFFNSLTATILTIYFLPLIHSFGISQTYFLFAMFSCAYFLVVSFLLPETKKKTLEAIQLNFIKSR